MAPPAPQDGVGGDFPTPDDARSAHEGVDVEPTNSAGETLEVPAVTPSLTALSGAETMTTPPPAKKQRRGSTEDTTTTGASEEFVVCDEEMPLTEVSSGHGASVSVPMNPEATVESKSGIVASAINCAACGQSDADEANPMLKCSGCGVKTHWGCYHDVGAPVDAEAWRCDVCRLPQDDAIRTPTSVTCVYCHHPGHALMKRIDTSRWSAFSFARPPPPSVSFGHLLCADWDPTVAMVPAPSSPAAADGDDVSKRNPSQGTTTRSIAATDDVFRLQLPVPPCCFCSVDGGVRVQCRQLYCGRFFHVLCASEPNCGRVVTRASPFPARIAYCDRHRANEEGIEKLCKLLQAKHFTALMTRDVAQKIATCVRSVAKCASLDDFLVSVIHHITEVCRRGLKASKADPPVYLTKHLQALQLVLSHLPQLRRLYDQSTFVKTDAELIADAELARTVQKMFNPLRFIRKFAGPMDPNRTCQVCHEPFQERQHAFYCTGAEESHWQHWRCTKRKSNSKDRTSGASAKKKAKSVPMVQQGVWKDVKLPKGFPSMSDGIACGVCREPVDARGVLAGRKEAIRADFEKPPSAFMFGGCFVNTMDSRATAAAGLRGSRPSGPVYQATKTSVKNSRRVNERDNGDAVVSPPPRMERIHVKRTTRWIACLGQVIKLVLATPASQASKGTVGAAAQGGSDVSTSDEKRQRPPEVGSGPVGQDDEAMNEESTAGDSDPKHTESRQSPVLDPEQKNAVCDKHQTTSAPSDQAPTAIDSKELGNTAIVSEHLSVATSDRPEAPATSEATRPPADAQHNESVVDGANAADKITSGGDRLGTTSGSSKTLVAADKGQESMSRLSPTVLAYLEEAKNVVRPFDAYALAKMETAQHMLETRSGPGLSVLRTLIEEYTRFLYIKHTRAVEKASNEKRKRQERAAQEERERERKRLDRESELTLKKQMLAMRKKQKLQAK